ncbi:butyrophilin subfamily 2 member A2-like [Erinaceus europaeus]|uniref:Butyrophilin subfamily 2 member A2-like n=1 Tax=Erinaceus europaeus TaxID=9365 RepID=A0ABM3XW68_ERIEU|nr:butyrophilin subfamily 2 member A2-like [Erinaceus europaeus]
MEVTWFLMDPPALVHRYAASQDHLEDQSPEYRGRTEFLKQNINTGQVALRIFPTLLSDGGEYRCLFESTKFSDEAQFKVLVTDAVFPRLWPWIVGLIVPLCLLAVGITFCVLFLQARRKQDSLQKQFAALTAELAQRKALGEKGLEKLRKFTEDITLDEDTAHPLLLVSRDRKYVIDVEEKQDVPDNPERFDTLRAVLGENSFSDGDHYWEVDVECQDRWEIGLCVDSVTQKGDIYVCPKNGFWALSLENNEYKALSTPPSILNVPEPPIVLGIFLQYEKGLISFYNVTDCSFLYTFKSTFSKPLKPYFYLGPSTSGNMSGLYLLS